MDYARATSIPGQFGNVGRIYGTDLSSVHTILWYFRNG